MEWIKITDPFKIFAPNPFAVSRYCPTPASPIHFPILLSASLLNSSSHGARRKITKIVAKIGGNQIRLVPVMSRVGGDASHGSLKNSALFLLLWKLRYPVFVYGPFRQLTCIVSVSVLEEKPTYIRKLAIFRIAMNTRLSCCILWQWFSSCLCLIQRKSISIHTTTFSIYCQQFTSECVAVAYDAEWGFGW